MSSNPHKSLDDPGQATPPNLPHTAKTGKLVKEKEKY